MDRERQKHGWPIVCFLTFLLVLFLTWPRAWSPAELCQWSSQPGEVGEELPPAPIRPAPPRPAPRKEGPRLAPIPALEGFRAEAEVADPVIATPGGRIAALPEGWDLGELQSVDLALPLPRPIISNEAEEPRLAQAEGSPPEPEPAAPSVTRLPPVVSNSPDDSLETIDLGPTLDAMVRQAPGPRSELAWGCGWPKPLALLERLEALAGECETGPWTMEAAGRINRFGLAVTGGSDEELSPILGRLEESACAAERQAETIDAPFLATELRRTSHALARQLVVWNEVINSGGPQTSIRDSDQLDPHSLSEGVAQVNRIPADPDALETWREYLELEPLEQALRQPA